jgi:hypothetical protein
MSKKYLQGGLLPGAHLTIFATMSRWLTSLENICQSVLFSHATWQYLHQCVTWQYLQQLVGDCLLLTIFAMVVILPGAAWQYLQPWLTPLTLFATVCSCLSPLDNICKSEPATEAFWKYLQQCALVWHHLTAFATVSADTKAVAPANSHDDLQIVTGWCAACRLTYRASHKGVYLYAQVRLLIP